MNDRRPPPGTVRKSLLIPDSAQVALIEARRLTGIRTQGEVVSKALRFYRDACVIQVEGGYVWMQRHPNARPIRAILL